MDNSLIGLVNRIQRVCTALGDYGGGDAVASLWESLPSVAVVGGQVCGRSFPHLAIYVNHLRAQAQSVPHRHVI
jgi:hypothetical protein